MFDKTVSTLIAVAAVVGIVAGGLYIANHTTAGCVDFLFFKSCGVVTH